MRSFIILVIAFSLPCFSSIGQDRILHGKVFDAETKAPLKNVVIAINGTTFTNDLGYFEVAIDPAKHKTILASRLGYKTIQIPVPSDDKFEFPLSKSYTELLTLDLSTYPNNNIIPQLDPKTKPHAGQVQSQAKFPGGIGQFYQTVGNALAGRAKQSETLTLDIYFTVDNHGKVTDLIFSDARSSTKADVTAVFNDLPAWTPAQQNGENVPQYFHLPLRKGGDVVTNESTVVMNLLGEMRSKINYPVDAQRMGVDGEFFLKFTLSESGDVLKVDVLKDPGAGCGTSAAQALSAASKNVKQNLVRHYKTNTFLLQGAFKFEKAPDAQDDNAGLLTAHKDAKLLPMRLVIEAATPEPYARDISSGNETIFINLANALASADSVKKLSLRNKALSVFPREILILGGLEYLDLEGNSIPSLPEDVDKLRSLRELYIVRNQLTDLPMRFGSLRKLTILGLSGNKLGKVPDAVLRIEKLETLDLSSNDLTQIPNELSKMINLKVLSLQKNRIAQIPAVLFSMQQLEKLYLVGNPLDKKDVEKLRNALPKTTVFF